MTSAVSVSEIIGEGFEQPNSKVTRLANTSHLTARGGLRMGELKTIERKRSGCKRSIVKRNGREGKKNRMVRVSRKELMPDSRLDWES